MRRLRHRKNQSVVSGRTDRDYQNRDLNTGHLAPDVNPQVTREWPGLLRREFTHPHPTFRTRTFLPSVMHTVSTWG